MNNEPRAVKWQRLGERIGVGLWVAGCIGFALFLVIVIAPRVV
jgi:hypothetical protein